jgi:hypothetical protein
LRIVLFAYCKVDEVVAAAKSCASETVSSTVVSTSALSNGLIHTFAGATLPNSSTVASAKSTRICFTSTASPLLPIHTSSARAINSTASATPTEQLNTSSNFRRQSIDCFSPRVLDWNHCRMGNRSCSSSVCIHIRIVCSTIPISLVPHLPRPLHYV